MECKYHTWWMRFVSKVGRPGIRVPTPISVMVSDARAYRGRLSRRMKTNFEQNMRLP